MVYHLCSLISAPCGGERKDSGWLLKVAFFGDGVKGVGHKEEMKTVLVDACYD
jgi:hypothetical protein